MKNSMMGSVIQSAPVQILTTVIIYSLYGLIMGLSLAPSVGLVAWTATTFMSPGPSVTGILAVSLSVGLGVYLYFITGILVMGIAVRIMSLGVKPGKYPQLSLTMVRWLIYSGVYHMAGSTILNFIPMTYFTNLFFRILGARIGKNVFINTWFLNDAYLLTIGDGVVIGGKSDISCHTFERGQLVLSPVTIGAGTLIGTHCYVSPGVTIGERSVIGQYSFIRKGRTLPDRSNITAIAGLDVREAAVIENSRKYLPSERTVEGADREIEGEEA
jgi:acetyltransferase-like isoleucine patch superfamily enzyme